MVIHTLTPSVKIYSGNSLETRFTFDRLLKTFLVFLYHFSVFFDIINPLLREFEMLMCVFVTCQKLFFQSLKARLQARLDPFAFVNCEVFTFCSLLSGLQWTLTLFSENNREKVNVKSSALTGPRPHVGFSESYFGASQATDPNCAGLFYKWPFGTIL